MKNKPNYSLATKKAYEVLLYNNLPIPIDLSKIKMKDLEIRIFSMQEWSKKYDISLDDLNQDGRIKEGYNISFKKNGVKRVIIFYNEDIESKERKRFTIAHEIGHVVLNHVGHGNEFQEREADTFAAQLLLPHCVLEELVRRGKNINKSYLTNKFGLSNEAAGISIEHVNKKMEMNATSQYEDIILDMYKNFIEKETRNSRRYNIDEELEMQSIRDSW